MSALISVIIPCFNASRWLQTALNSILGQTYQNIEVIAINDGSRDGTAAILEAVARTDRRLRVLHNDKNVGIAAACNLGLEAARGHFIAQMDADDVCYPQRLQRQIEFLEKTGIDLCGSWYREIGQGIPRAVRWVYSEQAVRTAMLFQMPFCHPTLFARRNFFERFHYSEARYYSEDYDLVVRASTVFRLALVPEVLLSYRRHRQQITSTTRRPLENVCQRIRIEALEKQGFSPSQEEMRLHNLIRAPTSIESIGDLEGIESWLMKLLEAHESKEAQRVIASQWIRACIRSAPLGRTMWRLYHASPLRAVAGGALADLDMRVLSMLRLSYRSSPFEALRRFGLSA